MSNKQTKTGYLNASRKLTKIALARRLYQNFSTYLGKVGLLAIVSLFSATLEAVTLGLLVILATTISRGDVSYSTNVPPWLGTHFSIEVRLLFAAIVVAILLRCLTQLLVGYCQSRIATSYESSKQREILAAYLAAPWAVQSETTLGSVQTLVMENVAHGRTALFGISQGLVAICNFFILVVGAFFVAPYIAAAILITATILSVTTRPLMRRSRDNATRKADLNLQFGTEVNQLILLAREIRVFGVADKFSQRLNSMVGKLRRTRMHILMTSTLLPAIYQNAVLLFGVFGLSMAWSIGIGTLESLGVATLMLVRAMSYAQAAQSTTHSIVEAVPYLDQIDHACRAFARKPVGSESLKVSHFDRFEFSNVSFAYHPNAFALSDINFQLQRGECLGLVGPSGSGKSTLMQLILGLRDPTEGSVLIDGVPRQEIQAASWFDRVSFVPQEPALLNQSIADCIRFFRDHLTLEEIHAAAIKAGVYDEILAMPKGFATMVGERGGRLSGGQRQRICIARALAATPDIVVFDEPTSALDSHSEAIVVDSINALRKHATVVVVAHRLSTLSKCNRVMVLQQGRITCIECPEKLEHQNAYFKDALLISRSS